MGNFKNFWEQGCFLQQLLSPSSPTVPEEKGPFLDPGSSPPLQVYVDSSSPPNPVPTFILIYESLNFFPFLFPKTFSPIFLYSKVEVVDHSFKCYPSQEIYFERQNNYSSGSSQLFPACENWGLNFQLFLPVNCKTQPLLKIKLYKLTIKHITWNTKVISTKISSLSNCFTTWWDDPRSWGYLHLTVW